jgi:hypothetical protein
MKRFHICYLVAKELCTGFNIDAVNYVDAVRKFNQMHGDKEIIYVATLNA